MNKLLLEDFINIPSVDGDETANANAVSFVSNYLTEQGFTVRVEGGELTDQPTLIAHYEGRRSTNKIVLYGHYDVAPVSDKALWINQNPFCLQEQAGRYYGRGVADNKGPLMARMQAVAGLLQTNKPVPEILWLIQGEEEVMTNTPVAGHIFKKAISTFGGNVFVDETGFNDIDTGEQLAFLWSPNMKEKALLSWKHLLHDVLNAPRVEYRHLNKFNGIDACPLLSNLPDEAVYIGFGPNDRLHQIHRNNESLDKEKLSIHTTQFHSFLATYAANSRLK